MITFGKKFGSTETRTPVAGFKVPSATDYTIEPNHGEPSFPSYLNAKFSFRST
jgi:hypothetical protein